MEQDQQLDILHLSMIKEVPSLNVAPNTIDATVLTDSEYVVYVQGLKDLGGALFNANFTEAFLWCLGLMLMIYI